MGLRVGNVVFDAPYAGSLDRFGRSAGSIADLYAALLGVKKRTRAEIHRAAGYPADAGDEADPILSPTEHVPIGVAFELQSEGYEPPRWPDPRYPQQIHLDIFVSDLEAGEALVLQHGAVKLSDHPRYRIFADPVGHPLCLYEDVDHMRDHPASGRVGRIVFDCFSPRSLARFYTSLLEMSERIEDSSERVVIGFSDRSLPMLAFQHSTAPAPRWPDPRFPEQVHLDLAADDLGDVEEARARALEHGAISLFSGPNHHVYADPAGHPFCL